MSPSISYLKLRVSVLAFVGPAANQLLTRIRPILFLLFVESDFEEESDEPTWTSCGQQP